MQGKVSESLVIQKSSRIYVAGHQGMVGSAIVRKLQSSGYSNIVTRTHQELDLLDQKAVADFMEQQKPEYSFMAAAKVGGILANNQYRADFLYQNLMIAANLIHGAWNAGISRLLFLGSSCIYPRDCPQPINEDYLLTGPLESTNEPYAIAKIAGIKLCENYNRQFGTHYVSAMPTNLYGPNDNFDLLSSHVLPALIRKAHEAKELHELSLPVWGDGSPRREFLHVDDLASACVFLMESGIGDGIYNVGTGQDISIRELIDIIKQIVCDDLEPIFDTTKPNGTPRKLLDVSRLHALGWHHQISLKDGISSTYDWYLKHEAGG